MKYLILLISVFFSVSLYAADDNNTYYDPVTRSIYSPLQNNDAKQRCRDIEGQDSPICGRLEILESFDEIVIETNDDEPEEQSGE